MKLQNRFWRCCCTAVLLLTTLGCDGPADEEATESADTLQPDTFVSQRPTVDDTPQLTLQSLLVQQGVQSRTAYSTIVGEKKLWREEYDRSGQCILREEWNPYGEVTKSCVSQYENDLLVRQSWTGDSTGRKVLLYNEGKLIREKWYSNQELSRSRFFYYYPNGNLQKTVTMQENCDTCHWMNEHYYEYNADGLVEQEWNKSVKKNDTSDSYRGEYIRYAYNRKGWVVREMRSKTMDNVPFEYRFRYHRKGLLVQCGTYTWDSDSLLGKDVWTLDDNLLPIEKTIWVGDMPHTSIKYRYTYFKPS